MFLSRAGQQKHRGSTRNTHPRMTPYGHVGSLWLPDEIKKAPDTSEAIAAALFLAISYWHPSQRTVSAPASQGSQPSPFGLQQISERISERQKKQQWSRGTGQALN